MWIELRDKDQYIDSSVRGLRLRFYNGVDPEVRQACKDFCKWLRKRYWFPIRVNCNFFDYTYFRADSPNDKDSVAVFYCSKNDNDKILPSIWVATGSYEKKKIKYGNRKALGTILHHIAHELTHYYQWYFYEFDNRTNRSLEMEATRWANYLLDEYKHNLPK